MSEKKAILGPVLGQAFSYGISNFPTILKAAGIPTVFLTGITLYFFLPSYISFAQLAEIADQSGDQSQILTAIGPFFANMALMFLAILFFYPMIITSITRNIVLGEDAPLLNLNGTVLRVLGAMILIGLIWMGAIFLGSLVAVPLVTMMTSAGFYPGLFLIFIAFILGLFALMAKSSLVLPDVAVNDRLRFAEGWQMSRGYVWPLIGTYFVLTILLGIIGNVTTAIALAIGGLGAGPVPFETGTELDPGLQIINEILSLTRSPIGIFAMLIYILGNIFTVGVQFAAFAFAYLQLGNPSADLPPAEN